MDCQETRYEKGKEMGKIKKKEKKFKPVAHLTQYSLYAVKVSYIFFSKYWSCTDYRLLFLYILLNGLHSITVEQLTPLQGSWCASCSYLFPGTHNHSPYVLVCEFRCYKKKKKKTTICFSSRSKLSLFLLPCAQFG